MRSNQLDNENNNNKKKLRFRQNFLLFQQIYFTSEYLDMLYVCRARFLFRK